MESAYKEDEKEQVSEEDEKEQVYGEHKKIHTEETEAECVILLTDSHARLSSSSSSSSSAYSSPPRNLPESSNEEDAEICSPGVQTMERGSNYDPNRIPSSVFKRDKSNIPAEWSCASNESLFSIHLGHNSFNVRGADLMRSGELYKSGELLAYSPALPMPPPPGAEPIIHEEVVDSDSDSDLVIIGKEQDEENKRESHEKEQHPAVSWKTPSTSYRSNRSSNSAHSFSFPILAGAASESSKTKTETETEEDKKQDKESVASEKTPSEAAANPQQPTSCNRWFSCFPPCPWCCPSRPPS